jgi:hypothetical protein
MALLVYAFLSGGRRLNRWKLEFSIPRLTRCITRVLHGMSLSVFDLIHTFKTCYFPLWISPLGRSRDPKVFTPTFPVSDGDFTRADMAYPPACTIGNDRAHDLALKSSRFGHIHRPKLGDTYHMPINRQFIVGKIETQSLPFLAFKARKPALFAILARMLELGKRPLFLHSPVVVESPPEIAEFLFRRAFCDLVAPGELFAFDPVILCLQVFHLGPFPLCPVVFPASQCPIVCMACNTARFPKVYFLFWGWIEPDHM